MTPSKKKREGEGKKGILGKREHHRCPSVIGICSLSGSSPPAGPGFALPATCLSLAPIGSATDSTVWSGVGCGGPQATWRTPRVVGQFLAHDHNIVTE